jgi:hypothetical protein
LTQYEFQEVEPRMTVTHVGSNKDYSTNWDSIFSGKKPGKAAPAGKAGAVKKPAAKKKAAKGKR